MSQVDANKNLTVVSGVSQSYIQSSNPNVYQGLFIRQPNYQNSLHTNSQQYSQQYYGHDSLTSMNNMSNMNEQGAFCQTKSAFHEGV